MGETKLSVDEAELYDRQIRLWGIESQEKLRGANVLLINVGSLGSEVAKNIVLTGINSLTLLDDGVVTKEAIANNFLLNDSYLGQKVAESVIIKAQALNPLVKITSETASIDTKDPKYFAQFTIVAATNLTLDQILKISAACRQYNVKFICGATFGMFGYAIADLQEHVYFEDRVVLSGKRSHAGAPTSTKKVVATSKFPDLSSVLPLPEEPVPAKRRNANFYLMQVLLQFVEKFDRTPQIDTKANDIAEMKILKEKVFHSYSANPDKLKDDAFSLVFGEIAPIASIVGGILSQEIIKAVSGKEVPINNIFLLDPFSYDGREEFVEITRE